ncbi:hypothetical protein TraAM80_05243 [Trypanosoma rangeli]|uniref:RING-type domain-containing protein n=1 Tax=Trypanosoma rangeli TaxID=5698 RepID=A0A422NFV6_TRYRA|nr:uncharacterized protein TraAM80_05243 [Trypanosoma rangeli]RNF04348.1 hypothetical protein TraAM80_05243 [Trypanosoma rangeli]|eukprot:RNF04348.1 hypothetical protein TraAM80_05243 [Trypanosoma rangeli]
MYREINPNDYETLLQLDDRSNRRVLTTEQFVSLRRGNWNDAFEYDTCHICLESFDSNSTCVWLLCGHFFHVSCAQSWLTEHSAVCPLDHIPVIVSASGNHVVEQSLPNLPAVRSLNRRVERDRRETAVSSAVLRRSVRTVPRRIERSIPPSTTSLPLLELQILPLGHLRPREQNWIRFRYGSS